MFSGNGRIGPFSVPLVSAIFGCRALCLISHGSERRSYDEIELLSINHLTEIEELITLDIRILTTFIEVFIHHKEGEGAAET